MRLLKISSLFVLLFFSSTLIGQIKKDSVTEISEVTIRALSKKQRGKEIMKQVIQKRNEFAQFQKKYSCSIYSVTSLQEDKLDSLLNVAQKIKTDTIAYTKFIDSILNKNTNTKHTTSLLEWKSKSYKDELKYKDEFEGYQDFSQQGKVYLRENRGSGTNSNMSGVESIAPAVAQTVNPYVFIKGLKQSDFDIYQNLIVADGICSKPIVSPLAFNAFLFYNFYLETTYSNIPDSIRYEIRVEPIFKEEALVSGSLLVKDNTWEVTDYQLKINEGALVYFENFSVQCNYSSSNNQLLPSKKFFDYTVRQGQKKIIGRNKTLYTDYEELDEQPNSFWNETAVYATDARNKDSNYWLTNRKFELAPSDKFYLHREDSIRNYKKSNPYLAKRDSMFNATSFWDVTLFGIGFRNTFKKREFQISPLIAQIVPLGVGGYRHRLSVTYIQGFKNGTSFDIEPTIDYGFLNRDLKGELALGYLYNPKNFSKITLRVGDIYDYINSYQSIQGTFGPGNRVRNQKVELTYRVELVNSLYLKTNLNYSNRISIGDMKYPKWVDIFGVFAKAQPFEGYKVLVASSELEYHPFQKYVYQENQKVVTEDKYPTLSLKYTTGIPKLLGGQSNFDYVEFRLTEDGKLATLGDYQLRFNAGSFIYKKDLRLIEYKYFRTSDAFLFSNPTNSMQLIDTVLSTASNYLQFNYIHHFNGFFLDKIWLLNKLKLEECIGGGLLSVPDKKFHTIELYAGLERRFKIKKQLFRFGIYAVQATSTRNSLDYQLKFGINAYDTFRQKWFY
ncbi:MAG: hypothetical protein EB100_00105 [Crocinitomicaceae bacterium]|nr:hypothetical protein [Crocinitomicaceae bacterium]